MSQNTNNRNFEIIEYGGPAPTGPEKAFAEGQQQKDRELLEKLTLAIQSGKTDFKPGFILESPISHYASTAASLGKEDLAIDLLNLDQGANRAANLPHVLNSAIAGNHPALVRRLAYELDDPSQISRHLATAATENAAETVQEIYHLSRELGVPEQDLQNNLDQSYFLALSRHLPWQDEGKPLQINRSLIELYKLGAHLPKSCSTEESCTIGGRRFSVTDEQRALIGLYQPLVRQIAQHETDADARIDLKKLHREAANITGTRNLTHIEQCATPTGDEIRHYTQEYRNTVIISGHCEKPKGP